MLKSIAIADHGVRRCERAGLSAPDDHARSEQADEPASQSAQGRASAPQQDRGAHDIASVSVFCHARDRDRQRRI
jgi:hypothetical protein